MNIPIAAADLRWKGGGSGRARMLFTVAVKQGLSWQDEIRELKLHSIGFLCNFVWYNL